MWKLENVSRRMDGLELELETKKTKQITTTEENKSEKLKQV